MRASKVLYGDWDKLRLTLTRYRENHDSVVDAILYENARFFVNAIQNRIRNQQFGSGTMPLSQYYLQRKVRAKVDPRMLISTGDYVDMFEVKFVAPKVYTAGASDEKHPSGLKHWELAAIHEYGKGAIPPRPHIMPARIEAMQFAKQNWKTYHKRVQSDSLTPGVQPV